MLSKSTFSASLLAISHSGLDLRVHFRDSVKMRQHVANGRCGRQDGRKLLQTDRAGNIVRAIDQHPTNMNLDDSPG